MYAIQQGLYGATAFCRQNGGAQGDRSVRLKEPYVWHNLSTLRLVEQGTKITLT